MTNKIFTRREFLKMTSMTAIAFAATNFFIGDSQIFAAGKNCKIKTRYGTYKGFVDKKGVRTWLGIPYAKPPVKNLRWQMPQQLEPSSAEFNAKKFGASPVQDIDEIEAASLNRQSEDCLTLNIWNRNSEGHKPVMVFIPGGGFVSGGSADPSYNGANLAAKYDVVVVTINYRINIFGFMNFGGIDPAFENSGALGIADQAMALAWVKENIENFGGDPDNVTIFGESAGASSVLLLSILPSAKGLFKKVISQSGHLAFYHQPERSAELAKRFMELNGCKNMGEMLNKPTAELEKTYEKLFVERNLSSEVDYFPTCNGKYLPALPFKALKDGAARGIKIMTGNTANEYRYWLLYYPDFLEVLPDFHKRITPIVYENEFTNSTDIYNAWQKNHMQLSNLERYEEFSNQLDWRVGQEMTAEYQSAYDDVYFYLFSQESPVKDLKSCHSIDIPFVFNNPSKGIEPNPSAKLVEQMQATWVAFATKGNPNNDLIPTWKPYKVSDRQTMEINDKAWTCHKDFNTQNLDELRNLYETFLEL